MNVLKTLKRISLKSFWLLAKLCLRFPFFVLPTLSATKQCMSTSTELYGRLHYKNGPANAFRHAFWNYLIAKRCFRSRKNINGVLIWAKKITDWHESAFPNRELAKKWIYTTMKLAAYFSKNTFLKWRIKWLIC